MRDEKEQPQPCWPRLLGHGLLVLSILLAAGYFLSSWMINAEIGGEHDLGIAITMAYVSTLGAYISSALAGASLLVAVIGALAGMRLRTAWLATALALLPLAWLLFSD